MDIFRILIPKNVRADLGLFEYQNQIISQHYEHYNTLEKIEDAFKNIEDNKVEEVLTYSAYLYEEEEKRTQQVESKGTLLAGFAGTILSVVLAAFAVFLSSTDIQTLSLFRLLGIIISVLVLISLILSIVFSTRVLAIRSFSKPNPKRIFDFTSKSVTDVKKRRFAEFFYSFMVNQYANDRKVDNLKYAIRCFRLSLTFVIVLIVFVSVYSTFPALQSETMMSLPTEAFLQPTVHQVTDTLEQSPSFSNSDTATATSRTPQGMSSLTPQSTLTGTSFSVAPTSTPD